MLDDGPIPPDDRYPPLVEIGFDGGERRQAPLLPRTT